jgi:hypothetical protein
MILRAGIVTVAKEFVPRFDRLLPPEHHVRSFREDHELDAVQMVVEGPMMPSLDDGDQLEQVSLIMEMNTPDQLAAHLDDEVWSLKARFESGTFRSGKILGEWTVAEFKTFESFQAYLRER